MIPMFRRIHKNQRGITLVEMLVVVVIIGLISGGIAMLISRTITGSARDSDVMILVRQVQQAGIQVTEDAYQAQTVEPPNEESEHPPESGFPVTFEWTHQDRDHVVRYSINARSELEREKSVYDDDQLTSQTTSIVARYINTDHDEETNLRKTSLKVLCNDSIVVLVFTVTATIGGHSETRIYEVKPRPTQGCPE